MTATAFTKPTVDLDATDFFCGIGGSSSGLVEAGWQVDLAANHSQTAIETHSANHPATEHLLADLETVDMRYLPRTRALWASPICTEVSPGGGKSKKQPPQAGPGLFEEYGHVPKEAFERTRVTFWQVLRAAEVHRYEVIWIENVVESFDWVLHPTFMSGLETLGYEIQIVNVSAAHVGDDTNPNAPQLRDRVYIVARLKHIPSFDLDVRPPAWCYRCDTVIEAIQLWKPPTKTSRGWKDWRVGKYNQQYVWACPHHMVRAEPLIMPATEAIDWTDLGIRIGDRRELGMRDLAARTMRRIGMGLEMISDPVLLAAAGNTWDAAAGSGGSYLRAVDPNGWPLAAEQGTATQGIATAGGKFVMAVHHDDHGRAFDPDHRPLPPRTTKNGESLVMTEPFITMLRENGKPTPVNHAPLQAFTTGRNHGLTIPPGAFVMKHQGGYLDDRHAVTSVDQPLNTVTTRHAGSLVVPFRKGDRPHTPDRPLSTLATHAQHGVMTAGERIAIEDCYFRMLSPREAANGQRFTRTYILTGTLGEQQLGAGNAVPVNVAHMLGRRVAEGLDSRAAA